MHSILYLGPKDQTEVIRETLGNDFDVRWAPSERDEVRGLAAHTATILDASMKLPFDRELLNDFTDLKLVITATTGADHIDSDTLTARGIPLLTLKGQNEILRQVNAAAEHSWLLLMACARQLRASITHVNNGGWDRTLFPGKLLRGKMLGLLGCGRIGQWMAQYAAAFEMKVGAYDPHLRDWPDSIERMELDELLTAADYISIHVPLNHETTRLISGREFALMKHGVVLINTSRGAVVDEEALIEELESGRVAAAGLDVLEDEPDISKSRLWQFSRDHPQCVITPHIGGFSPEALAIVLKFTAQRIARFFCAN